MQGDIGVGGIRVQALAHRQHRFAMAFYSLANKMDIRSNCEIPRSSFPHEMKRIHSPPHVGAAAGDAILAGGSVIRSRALSRVIAHIAMRLEQADGV